MLAAPGPEPRAVAAAGERGDGGSRRPRGFRAHRPGGFTILELALVLTITALLAGMAVFVYGRYVNKARFTQAMAVLKHLQKTETIYFTENGRYTDNVALLDFDPLRYNYYVVRVVVDNTGMNYTGYADGVGVMAGDRWHIERDGDPVHDTPGF